MQNTKYNDFTKNLIYMQWFYSKFYLFFLQKKKKKKLSSVCFEIEGLDLYPVPMSCHVDMGTSPKLKVHVK